MMVLAYVFILFCVCSQEFVNGRIMVINRQAVFPIVMTTWAYSNATANAWNIMARDNGSALDAVERGCSTCEEQQCNHAVGYGGKPDEGGETTLDAVIVDGLTLDAGAVGCLRRVKSAMSVARKVLEHTQHTLLVGELATQFAIQMGFKEENLTSDFSRDRWQEWRNNNCQPNFWKKNVSPDPTVSCGPYKRNDLARIPKNVQWDPVISETNHDTIGMVAIDSSHNVAAGASTNGLEYKIEGRVGDSSVPGAGAYADNDVGGAVATGNGDIMMRFLPSLVAVEEMRRGAHPATAAEIAVGRIARFYPTFSGAVVAASVDGRFGAACHGIERFPLTFQIPDLVQPATVYIKCLT